MPGQGCVDHTINNLILLQYWLKLRNKLREGVNPQQSFNVKLVPQEKTAYTKYNNYLWVVVKYYYPINPRGHWAKENNDAFMNIRFYFLWNYLAFGLMYMVYLGISELIAIIND